RRNYDFYRDALADLPGVAFIPQATYGRPTCWLTCITIDPRRFGATREQVRLALEAENIESRPLWKPLHMQPAFAHCRMRGGAAAADLFEHGLCLPSGSSMTDEDLHRVVDIIRSNSSPLGHRVRTSTSTPAAAQSRC